MTHRSTLWARKNPEKFHAKQKKARDLAKARNDGLKDQPCADCGGRFPPECMDFDHVRGTKEFSIGQGRTLAPSRIKAELAKCELVCANCHRIRSRKRMYGRKTT